MRCFCQRRSVHKHMHIRLFSSFSNRFAYKTKKELRQSIILLFFCCENWNYTVTTLNELYFHCSIHFLFLNVRVCHPMYTKQLSFSRKFLGSTHMHWVAFYLTVFKHLVCYDEHIFFAWWFSCVWLYFDLKFLLFSLLDHFNLNVFFLVCLWNHSSVNVFNVKIINV